LRSGCGAWIWIVDNGDMAADPIDVLDRALEQIRTLIAQVHSDQTSRPTPCKSWDVAALLDHVLADLPRFIDSARGGQPDYSLSSPSVAPNWASEFATRSDELVHAWRDARDPSMLEAGQMPTNELIDGGIVLAGGVLLVVPGDGRARLGSRHRAWSDA